MTPARLIRWVAAPALILWLSACSLYPGTAPSPDAASSSATPAAAPSEPEAGQLPVLAFDDAILLDVDLLQGLVQLVQSAPSGSLVSDDLVKILRVLRIRLQDTHQQSSVHPFYLTLAVSRLLDVMAEHKKGVGRGVGGAVK